MLVVVGALIHSGIARLDLVHLAVVQRQVEIGLRLVECHVAGIRIDDPVGALASEIEDHQVDQYATLSVDARRLQEQLAADHLVDHPFPQLERRLLPADVGEQHAKLMVRLRQDVVVEPHHQRGQQGRYQEHRVDQAAETDAARPERSNLVVGAQSTEGVEDGDQHGHWHGHRQDERHIIGRIGKCHRRIGSLLRKRFLEHELRLGDQGVGATDGAGCNIT